MTLKVMAMVDDEKSFILRLKLVLAKAKIVTQGFIDFSDADSFIPEFAKAKSGDAPFEVVFIDINLKSGQIANGLDLLSELRTKYNGSAVIAVMSTSTRKEEVAEAEKRGANAYIVKSGKLDVFTNRMLGFKEHYLDKRSDQFMVFGEEELI